MLVEAFQRSALNSISIYLSEDKLSSEAKRLIGDKIVRGLSSSLSCIDVSNKSDEQFAVEHKQNWEITLGVHSACIPNEVLAHILNLVRDINEGEYIKNTLQNGTETEKSIVFRQLIVDINNAQLPASLKNDRIKIRDAFLGMDKLVARLKERDADRKALMQTLYYSWGGNISDNLNIIETLKTAALSQFSSERQYEVKVEFNSALRDTLADRLPFEDKTSYYAAVESKSNYEAKKIAVFAWWNQSLKS